MAPLRLENRQSDPAQGGARADKGNSSFRNDVTQAVISIHDKVRRNGGLTSDCQIAASIEAATPCIASHYLTIM